MLRAAELLAAWCEVGDQVAVLGQWEKDLIAHARKVGPEATAEYAAHLAAHAGAELQMERLQSLYDWPAV